MSVFRRYRFLIIVIGLAAFAALWEPQKPEKDDQGYSQEQILETYEKNKKSYEILMYRYPEGEEYYRVAGILLAKQGDFVEARKNFEQALASGVKTNEDNFYLYALTLVAMDAPEDEIDQAIANWKYHHPYSTRLDPRDKQAVENFLRSSRTNPGQSPLGP